MPVTTLERVTSRRRTTGSSPSIERLYRTIGTASEIAALADVEAAAPSADSGLPRRQIDLEPDWVDTIIGDGAWNAVVTYGTETVPDVAESSFSFDTTGGTQHIAHALATIAAYAPAGGTAPDFDGALNVTDQGVEGLDIELPVYRFAETHYTEDDDVTPAYKGTLFSLTGRVNNNTFKGLAAGDCLFLGAQGTRRGAGADDLWEISYQFAGSPNVTGLSVGPITNISKLGWEYLWVRYAVAEDATAKALVRKPIAVYIEQIYKVGDFSQLDIGV